MFYVCRGNLLASSPIYKTSYNHIYSLFKLLYFQTDKTPLRNGGEKQTVFELRKQPKSIIHLLIPHIKMTTFCRVLLIFGKSHQSSYQIIETFYFAGIYVAVSRAQSVEDDVFHFTNPSQGNAVWILDESSLPWTGGYQYLR